MSWENTNRGIAARHAEQILSHRMFAQDIQPRPSDIEFDRAADELAEVIEEHLDQSWAETNGHDQ